MTTLGEIVGIHKGTRSAAQRDFDIIYKSIQKPDNFNGLDKTHDPFPGELPQPHQEKLVQSNALGLLSKMEEVLTRAINVEATKDIADQSAKADIIVGDETVLRDVPISHILWLEKQVTDFVTVFRALPIQSAAEKWESADNLPAGVYRTPTEEVPSTKKITDQKVVIPPTDQHPGQWTEISKDVQSGTWKTTKFTAALPAKQKEILVRRATDLLVAVQQAATRANHASVVDIKTEGQTIFGYLFDNVLDGR